MIDLFDGTTKKLLWRGLATADLSTNAGKKYEVAGWRYWEDVQRLPAEAGQIGRSSGCVSKLRLVGG